ncbi:hypothetical protein CYLTODRAFT_456472 [Cylindrobasidium torrendii FP15055 ss-10]|uniref:Serine hydrolase domain-containing protein n=1 Tax=Cylindrobasidium torrendii FP15055 ss-10 TaxID=1314674 RepID=A0A0D7B4Z7_9AGAR|nr:hypothetical protein CYLTODRAFT_456472 [Cylindrobasidium torrendii FP15055 ss-10]
MALTRKILVLHGYGQNAFTMSRSMSPILESSPPELEFLFLDAPHALAPLEQPSCPTTLPSASPVEDLTPRAWVTSDADLETVANDEDESRVKESTLDVLKRALMEEEYEGVMGIGQGAAVAELVAAMTECPDLYPEFNVHGRAVHPPLKYLVCVSGYLLRGTSRPVAINRNPFLKSTNPFTAAPPSPPATANAFGAATRKKATVQPPAVVLQTPVLHVLGYKDPVVPNEKTLFLLAHHRNRRVEQHIGGHFVPTRPPWPAFFSAFFEDPFGVDVASPTSASLRLLPQLASHPQHAFLESLVGGSGGTGALVLAPYRLGEPLPAIDEGYDSEDDDVEEEGFDADLEEHSPFSDAHFVFNKKRQQALKLDTTPRPPFARAPAALVYADKLSAEPEEEERSVFSDSDDEELEIEQLDESEGEEARSESGHSSSLELTHRDTSPSRYSISSMRSTLSDASWDGPFTPTDSVEVFDFGARGKNVKGLVVNTKGNANMGVGVRAKRWSVDSGYESEEGVQVQPLIR